MNVMGRLHRKHSNVLMIHVMTFWLNDSYDTDFLCTKAYLSFSIVIRWQQFSKFLNCIFSAIRLVPDPFSFKTSQRIVPAERGGFLFRVPQAVRWSSLMSLVGALQPMMALGLHGPSPNIWWKSLDAPHFLPHTSMSWQLSRCVLLF